MARISSIFLQDAPSGVTLALREDGHYVVGLCLTKGAEHIVTEHVDFYSGHSFDSALAAFHLMTRPREDYIDVDGK